MRNEINNKQSEKSEISRWWNNERNKRWDNFFEGKDSNSYRMNMRAETILKVIKERKKKLKIFEIGFGAGQIAKMILELGHTYQGIDISQHLTDFAIKRNKHYVDNSLAKFDVGSIDDVLNVKNQSFDIVIAVGVLQYSNDLEFTIKEMNRILKVDGLIIVCQTNMYDIQRMFSLRRLIIRFYYLVSKHQYEITPSFYSLIFDTNLNNFFKFDKDNKFFKKRFFLKNYSVMNYGFKKNLMSVGRLKYFFKKENLLNIKYCGAPFFYSDNQKVLYFLNLINKILFVILNLLQLKFLFRFADNITLVFKKNDSSS